MDLPWPKYFLLSAVLAMIILSQFWRSRHRLVPYPPGPPGLPILGNFLDIPRTAPWIQFAKWRKKYGPVIYLNLLGRPLVVLNTAKATIDLLERRGGKYANRPGLTMVGEIVGYKGMMIMSQYDHAYREQRKLISGTFGRNQVVHLHESLEKFASQLACALCADPGNVVEIVRQHIGNLLLSVIYGLDDRREHAEHIATASQCSMEFLDLAFPGKFLVDSLPFLKHIPSWVPLSPRWQAIKWRETADKVQTLPYSEAKRRVENGVAQRSFLTQTFTRQKAPEMEQELSMLAAILFIAGSDTIGSAMRSVIFSLMNYQDAHRKGQAEIDKVVGSGRLPILKDRENLPYVTAFCREILRLHVPAPLGFVHIASSDDVYEGHHIPAGAMVLSNIWEILHDPQNYQDPWEFDPDRFMNTFGTGIDLVELGFGSGRRQCPGKYLVFDTLFITVATFMAVFDIHLNEPVEPSNLPSGIAIRAETLNCILTHRNTDAMTFLEPIRKIIQAREHSKTLVQSDNDNR